VEKTYPFELFKFGQGRTINNSGEEAIARKEGFCEPYQYQEYPKHLYMGGKREVDQTTFAEINTVSTIVKSAEEEKAARAKGFRRLGEVEEPAANEAEETVKPKKKAA